MIFKFECRKCGKCCRNLITKKKPRQGLMLLPEECHLFSKEHVIPSWGVGKHPKKDDFQMITYQMTENVCPQYKESKCQIYQNRPIKCRSYPLEAIVNHKLKRIVWMISPDCSWSQEMKKRYPLSPPQNSIPKNSIEYRTSLVLSEFYRQIDLQIGKMRSWQFDVVKRKWVRM